MMLPSSAVTSVRASLGGSVWRELGSSSSSTHPPSNQSTANNILPRKLNHDNYCMASSPRSNIRQKMNLKKYVIQILISQFRLTHFFLNMNRIVAKSPSTVMPRLMRRCRQEIIRPIIVNNQWGNRYHHRSRSLPLFFMLSQEFQSSLDVVRSPSRIVHHEQQQFSTSISYVSHHKPYIHSNNRYERFRRVLNRMTLSQGEIVNDSVFSHDKATNLLDFGKHAMEVISSNRRSFNRSWKRMKPLIELILQSYRVVEDGDDQNCTQTSNQILSIADVGCDHGLLALSLACMSLVVLRQNAEGCQSSRKSHAVTFARVIGTDVSPIALENGGHVSYKKLIDVMMKQSGDGQFALHEKESKLPLPIEFRVGYGLEPLQPGEGDALVMAGMGHLTMIDVLFGSGAVDGERHHHNSDDEKIPSVDRIQTQYHHNSDDAGPHPVDRIHTQRVFLQPTNSRPQHMIELYDRMQESGEWELKGETIALVGGRYYINSYFERMRNKFHGDTSYRFPGHFMVRDTLDRAHAADSGCHVYDSYVKHHIQWLKEDYQRPQYTLVDEDRRWLEYISSAEESEDRWRNLVSWFSS